MNAEWLAGLGKPIAKSGEDGKARPGAFSACRAVCPGKASLRSKAASGLPQEAGSDRNPITKARPQLTIAAQNMLGLRLLFASNCGPSLPLNRSSQEFK